ncbi:NAD(P)-dependent oxidoreductase [Yoonia sediminilitoris]|uniref:Phosphoglycerate dehydrogenase-like enzyme n=1 Tax=Yoonia sediminilitoris TaxID=1286148 RepID=A0A2T6KHG3_9RHOB|nr:NAD(P)-dependent oxidoreductase [Yoonia sediminilitoris]PUB14960.1 phosphoglycerate dehydrogenase-like enzyme [Yoonia sediminilitoris]RCW95676.1 phosphoglycerate dehydrogenase-like enzyme [Yoonia sediminilitoris]
MTKPTIILDPHWRQMDELFSAPAQAQLFDQYNVVWGKDDPMPPELLAASLPDTSVLIAATPHVQADALAAAPQLRAVIEVSGAFPDTIDYAACDAAGVEVLSCAPGFRRAVAEMGLGMAIAGARGLVTEHEQFRAGGENWLNDNTHTDFSLFGAEIGFIGFGQIAQELSRLLAPFSAQIKAYDPWLPTDVADRFGVTLMDLDALLRNVRCLFVTAVPTVENLHLLNASNLAKLPDQALVVLLSRAHLVDFDALTDAVTSGRIRAAIDVFPHEPIAADDPLRRVENVILSPHRAAAVKGGRQLIGDMIVADLSAIFSGGPARQLGRADTAKIGSLAGVGDAAQVADMAKERK